MKPTQNQYQQQLIESPPEIEKTVLQAEDSPRRAYYEVSVLALPAGGGFCVRKLSGAAGSKPVAETWWRPSLALALEKKALLIAAKLKKRKGRVYMEIQDDLPACRGL